MKSEIPPYGQRGVGGGVTVVGAGVMGAEIAWVVAGAGRSVVLVDHDGEALSRASDHLRALGTRRVARGRMAESAADALRARIRMSPSLGACADSDLAIEAVTERLAVKRAVFAALDIALPSDAVIASNTSGVSISALGASTDRPERVLGLHFFNPASVMQLVEVVRGEQTSDDTVEGAVAFVRALGKTPVIVRECPGFLVNRILVRAMAEAYREAATRRADPAGVDLAVTMTGPAPMGPFALGDLIGLDTLAHVRRDLETAYGARFDDGGVLDEQVSAGRLGTKSGEGFLASEEGRPAPDGAEYEVAGAFYRGARQEAERCRDEGIAREHDIALAMDLGCGWTSGPLGAPANVGRYRQETGDAPSGTTGG